MKHHTKVLIIGSGPAGYTAAIYAARANLSPIQVLGLQPGGQLMITTDVENYPGFADVIQGPWLMEQMKAQTEKVGAQLIHDIIQRIDFSVRPFVCCGDTDTYTADTIILATGAQAKWLGIESEEKFRGFGVSGCATCDGFFYRNKCVAVIGGGNTAVEEALYLTHHAKEIFLIHRRDALRAEKILQDRLFSHPKIKVLWNQVVEEFLGTSDPRNLTHIRLKSTETHEEQMLAVDGAFVAIGHRPMTELVKGFLTLDSEGYILCQKGTTFTNIPGVFAAGDVQDRVYRQAITAAGQGCMAALDAEKFISTLS